MVLYLLRHISFIACDLLFAKCILHPANDLRFSKVCIWCECTAAAKRNADRTVSATCVCAVCAIKLPVYCEYYVLFAVEFWVCVHLNDGPSVNDSHFSFLLVVPRGRGVIEFLQ